MKKYKQYLSWLTGKQKEKDPEHKADHVEEVLKDTGVPITAYMAALKESSVQLSDAIDQYRNNKLSEVDFKAKLRTMKQNITLVLMKLETGW